VIGRAEPPTPQLLGEGVGIVPIVFVPLPRLTAPIAHDQTIDVRGQQVVQPLGLRPFLDRDVDRPPHPPEELRERWTVRRQDAPGDHPATLLAH